MIVETLIIIGDIIIRTVSGFLQTIPYIIPSYMFDAMEAFLYDLNKVQGLFPIRRNPVATGAWATHGMVDTFIVVVNFIVLLLGAKLAFKIAGIVPFIKIGNLLSSRFKKQ